MSAFIAVRKSTSIDLLTDAASFRKDGSIAAISSKITVLPRMICAVAYRGWRLLTADVIDSPGRIFGLIAAAKCETFDNMIERFPELQLETQRVCERVPFSEAHGMQLVIAGWSEGRQRPESYHFATKAKSGFAAMVLHEADGILVAGSLPSWEQVLAHGWTDPQTEDDFDPRIDGLAMLEAMRSEPMEYDAWPDANIIGLGGFAELATITRAGVTCEVIRRWDDRVGLPIERAALR